MTEIKSYYESYWDRDSDVSDADPTTPERRRRLLDVLAREVPEGSRVLDLGCGAGKFAAWMNEAGYQAMGVDVSGRAVEKARRDHPEVRYEVLEADGRIPCEDETLSAVWSSEVIEHILPVDQYLSEVRRVLRPGGLFVLTTPYHGLIKNLGIVLLGFSKHFKPEGSHIRFFDRAGLSRVLIRAGFEPVSFAGIGRAPFLWRTWFVVARKSDSMSQERA